jgi:hypothetical protein
MANLFGASLTSPLAVTATSYGTSFGPSATATIESSKLALVIISGSLSAITSATSCQISFSGTGTGISPIAAGTTYQASISAVQGFGQVFLVPVSAAGSMTFKVEAKVTGTSKTCTYSSLSIAVSSPRLSP